jgi:hypothetical protein
LLILLDNPNPADTINSLQVLHGAQPPASATMTVSGRWALANKTANTPARKTAHVVVPVTVPVGSDRLGTAADREKSCGDGNPVAAGPAGQPRCRPLPLSF